MNCDDDVIDKMLNLVHYWLIWKKNGEIRSDVGAFQPSQDKIWANKDKMWI